MHQGQYDKDCTTWNPDGKITQISHAMAAVQQGTAVLACRTKTHAVVAAFKKQGGTDLSSHAKKIFKIDDHMGIGISGLTADARVLADFMRGECLDHKYVYESPMNAGRLVAQIGEKAQAKTQIAGKRPYGVGLLVISYDEASGPHVFETCPSANYYEYHAMAIGGRSQSAKTYLERHFETFADMTDPAELIRHAVKALSVTTTQDKELTVENLDVAVVGKGTDFYFLNNVAKQEYLDALRAEQDAAGANDVVMGEN